ncbi:hypothetical protein R1flu_024129 [Riccia fluitans]|uniref:Uncharacterized protein n=1 Tax=Riccia fluitans TaxID=41844 RepID=A0ABD1XU14_9MARC
MGSSDTSGGGLRLFAGSPHGGDEENQTSDFEDRAVERCIMDVSIGWETTPKGTTEQLAEMPQTLTSHIELPIPPAVGDDNGLPMEVAWAIPFNVKEW